MAPLPQEIYPIYTVGNMFHWLLGYPTRLFSGFQIWPQYPALPWLQGHVASPCPLGVPGYSLQLDCCRCHRPTPRELASPLHHRDSSKKTPSITRGPSPDTKSTGASLLVFRTSRIVKILFAVYKLPLLVGLVVNT